MRVATTIALFAVYVICAFTVNYLYLGDTTIGAGLLGGLIGPWLVWMHS